ncbi:hypothetical protein M1D46_07485 [Microbacterium sp. JZ70]
MMRRALAPLLAAGVLLSLAGCASSVGTGQGAEPDPTPSATSTPTTAPTTSVPTTAPGVFTMPASCEQAWSTEALSILSEEAGALNDPGLTMLSTEVVPALEVLDAVESLRCTWGLASEVGIATTLAAVDEAQTETIRTALLAEGFTCEEREVVTRCELETELTGEVPGATGEVHVLGGGGWAATHWLNADFEPQYTDDLIATLWM